MKLAASAVAVTALMVGLAGPAAGGGPRAGAASNGPRVGAARPAGARSVRISRGPVAAQAGWKAGRAPLPAGAAADALTTLSQVVCPSATRCVAAGSYQDAAGNFQGMLLMRHRRGWTAIRAPLPAGAATQPASLISGLACPSVTLCVAAGSYQDAAGNFQGMLLMRHRRGWTAIRAPLPAGAATNPETGITAVACGSATACAAIGGYTDSSGSGQLLLLTMRGSSWTAAAAPVPPDAAASGAANLAVLACPSASACTAAGTYLDSSDRSRPLVLTMRGSSWTAAGAPLPADAPADPYIYILGLACRSARACVATGYYGDASSPAAGNEGLLLTRRGSSWTATTAPLPGGISAAYTSVWAVACPPGAGCTAVGSYLTPPGTSDSGGLLLTRHRRSWRAVQAPLPADAASSPVTSIRAVACPTATACTAIGSYSDSAANSQGLLLTRHRNRWTAATAPLPAGAATNPEVYLTGIACPSATACAAIGNYTDSAGNVQGLLLTKGHSHSFQPTAQERARLWPEFEDDVDRGLGDPPEPAEAGVVG